MIIMRHHLKRCLCIGLVAVFAQGCTTARGYRLVVCNAGPEPIRDVEVRAGDAVRYTAATINADQFGAQRRTEQGLPAVSEVRWKDNTGTTHTQRINAGKPLRDDFRGRVVYQIKGTDIRVFAQPATDSEASEIPWGFDDRVDGTVSMPGMPRGQR